MPLMLYRRHLRSCRVHTLGLPPAAKRFYRECDCPIWMCGRTDRIRVPRQSTGLTEWAAATAMLKSVDAESQDTSTRGPRLAECIEVYAASRAHELSPRTLAQHELVLGRLREYCTTRGIQFARELTVDHLELFKASLPLADTSKGTATAKLRCFLREAFRRSWIEHDLAAKVSPHTAIPDQKEPYTDDEVVRILDGALLLRGPSGYARHPATFRLLLELMLETGLRVGDAIRFDPSQLERGSRLWIYTFTAQKRRRTERPRPMQAYLTDRLKSAIDGAEWLSERLPFTYGQFRNPSYLGNEVYERMRSIGARAEVGDCRPHRLRDTFAVRKLLAGIALEDVSRLLGHSSVKVTETYYAKWVTARRERLERMLAETLGQA